MYNPCIINQAFFTYVLFLLHFTINVILIYVHSLKWDKFADLMNINKIIWNYLLWRQSGQENLFKLTEIVL